MHIRSLLIHLDCKSMDIFLLTLLCKCMHIFMKTLRCSALCSIPHHLTGKHFIKLMYLFQCMVCLYSYVHGGLMVSVLDCQLRGSGFKSQPGQKCDRLRQKQAFGEKISFADFSIELIN